MPQDLEGYLSQVVRKVLGLPKHSTSGRPKLAQTLEFWISDAPSIATDGWVLRQAILTDNVGGWQDPPPWLD
jgi:hypothetical protein